MTQSASQAAAFYKEVAENKIIWSIRDKDGFVTSHSSMPMFSSLSRAEKFIKTVPVYSKCMPVEISWEDFVSKWIPGLTRDGLLAGVNWTGERATGYDVNPADLQKNVEVLMK